MHTNRLGHWGRLYVIAVIALGGATVAYSAYQLHARPIGWNWTVLALLTLLSGSATVKLPSVPATISVSETFVFTSVLLFGPAAGTITVTLDVLAISLWLARRNHPFYRLAFNIFALPSALWVGAHAFYLISGLPPLALTSEAVPIGLLVLPLLAFTLIYFTLNSWLIAFAIALETQGKPFLIWKDNFAWLSLNYFGGASVAALLVTYTRNLDLGYVAFVIPLLAVLYFTFSTAMGRVEDSNRHLRQLNTLYMSTIETLAMAIDAKDQITHGHIRRVQTYAVGLAKELGMSESQISAIEAASLLHDMGKLAVPEYILNKPGPLTPAEFEKMKMHASVGADILSAIDFPYPVVPIVRHHHENWDGTGYPDGLSGTDIPIGARILSVVDCFDALTSDRPYRPRLADREALKIVTDRRGKMYDPLIVDTFSRVHTKIAPTQPSDVATVPLGTLSNGSLPAVDTLDPSPRLDEISASSEEMLTLFDLARNLNWTTNVEDILEAISKHVRRLIPSSLSVFFIHDDHSDELVADFVLGEQANLVTGLRIPRGQRLSGWVAANRQTIRNSDPVLDLGESARVMNPRPRSALSTPLMSGADLVGVLSLYSTSRDGFNTDHERLIEILARQVAPVLKHALDEQRERTTRMRDSVTGLPNVEQFAEFCKSFNSSDSQSASAVLVINMETVKTAHGQYHRGFSDLNLTSIVEAVRRGLRTADLLFRDLDGRFIAVLLQTTEETAHDVARRVEASVLSSAEIDDMLTVQIGLAASPRDALGLEELLVLASQRLRQSPLGIGNGPGSDSRVH